MIMLFLALAQPLHAAAQDAPAPVAEARALAPIDDAALVAFLAKPFDPRSRRIDRPRRLGLHRGTPVVVTYRCSDVCPDYTRRIVHYAVTPGPACDAIGGLTRDIRVPRGIGVGLERFCIPAVTSSYQD